jgi:hypothetical protein
MARPLSDLQRQVLVVLFDAEQDDPTRVLIPNEIGERLDLPVVEGGRGRGRGKGHRVFGAAQRIIPALTGLGTRGLVRRSFASSRGYELTGKGQRIAKALKEEACATTPEVMWLHVHSAHGRSDLPPEGFEP